MYIVRSYLFVKLEKSKDPLTTLINAMNYSRVAPKSLRSRVSNLEGGLTQTQTSTIPVSALESTASCLNSSSDRLFGLNPRCALVQSACGDLLYSCGYCVISLNLDSHKQRLFPATSLVQSFALSNDGDKLAIGISGTVDSPCAKLLLFDYETSVQTSTICINGHGEGVVEIYPNGITFNMNRNILAVASASEGLSFVSLVRTSPKPCSSCDETNVSTLSLPSSSQIVKLLFSPFDPKMLCVSSVSIKADVKSGALHLWLINSPKEVSCCCCSDISQLPVEGFDLIDGEFTDISFEPALNIGSTGVLLQPPGLDSTRRGRNLEPFSFSPLQPYSTALPASLAGPGLPPSRLISSVQGEDSPENRLTIDRSKVNHEKVLRLFATTSSGSVAQVNVATRRVEGIFRLHDNSIQSVSLSMAVLPSVNLDFGRDETRVNLTSDAEGGLRLWSSSFSENLWQAKLNGSIKSCLILQQQNKPLCNESSNRWKSRTDRLSSNLKIAFISDCSTANNGCRLGIVEARILSDVIPYAPNTSDRKVVVVVESHAEDIVCVSSVIVFRDRHFLGTLGQDASIKIWPVIEARDDSSLAAVLQTDGYFDYKKSTAVQVTCLTLREAQPSTSHFKGESHVYSDRRLGLSSLINDSLPCIEAVIGFSDGTIDIVHVNSNTVVRSARLHSPRSRILCLMFTSLGSTLFSVGSDGLLIASSGINDFRIIGAISGTSLDSENVSALMALSPNCENVTTWFSESRDSHGSFTIVRASDMEILAQSRDDQLHIGAEPLSICCVSENGDFVSGFSDGRIALFGFSKDTSFRKDQRPSCIALLSRPLLLNSQKSAVVSVSYYAQLRLVFFALKDGRRGHISVTELRCNTIDTDSITANLISDGIIHVKSVIAVQSASKKCMLFGIDKKAILSSSPFSETVDLYR